MPPPIPILRHDPNDSAGYLASSLHSSHLLYHYYDLYSIPAFPDPSALSSAPALILLGGPQSVNSSLPFLSFESRLLARFLSQNKPVLAICLGAQLLAQLLGAAIRPCPTPEIGFFPVSALPPASSDPLFSSWSSHSVFHWHNELFDLPSATTPLASSSLCPNQAFRYGDACWGLQFHLEVTPQNIATWCAEDAAAGPRRELHHPLDPHLHAAPLAALANDVFSRWARLVAERNHP